MRLDELKTGKLVWFWTDDGQTRVGLIGKITTRGSIKADILWQKGGSSYTVKRTPVDKIQKFVEYPSYNDEQMAIKKFCDRVLTVGSKPTGSAEKMALEYV